MNSHIKIWHMVALPIAGFSMAWLIKSHEMPAVAESGEMKPRSASAGGSHVRASRSKDDALTKSLVDDYLAGFSPAITKNDYRKMMDELVLKLDEVHDSEAIDFLSKLEKLLGDWYETDPDAALRYALTKDERRTPYLSNYMPSFIIGRVSETDLEAALALAKRYGQEDGRHIPMPEQLLDRIGKGDAEEFLRISSLFTQESGYSVRTVEFADGFDYKRALDGLVDIQTGLEGGIHTSLMPSNLLWEWAKRDWEGAIQWAVTGKEVMHNDLFSLAERVAGTSSTEEYASLVAFVAGSTAQKPVYYDKHLWDMLALRASPELINSYLQQAPGGRQQNVPRIFEASLRFGSGQEQARDVLISQMTPAERFTAFQSEAAQERLDDDREAYSSLLRRLGHSDEEINTMLTRVP
jgi:hypothetical protein